MSEPHKDPDATIALVEEHLTVQKRRVVGDRVKVRVLTDTETVNAKASLFDQAVDVKRVPVGREVTEVPPIRQEGDTTIVPVLEEIVVVEKRLVLIEEVHIRQVVTQVDVEQPVSVRRQRAEIVRTAAAADEAVSDETVKE
jgi:stress response protein YsnF